MENQFKVGDKVVKVLPVESRLFGKKGTIKFNDGTGIAQYAVEFDEEFLFGGDCSGHCADGKGSWCCGDFLKLIPQFKVGDKVKVLPWEEIKGKLGNNNQDSHGVMFISEMKQQCGKILTIDRLLGNWGFTVKEVDCSWTDNFCVPYEEPKFEVGQVYRVGNGIEKGNIIKIAKIDSGCFRNCIFATIKGAAFGNSRFAEDSIFAKSLTLLTGSEIGEAIRKWDEEHAPKSEPEYTEVKRKAKVGEKIKIVNPCMPSGYEKGSIGISTADGNTSVYAKFASGVHCVYHTEYVVLEPKQTVREVKRAAKAGEYIKIVDAQSPHRGYDTGDIILVDHIDCGGDPYGKDTSWIDSAEYVVLENYKPQGKHSYTAEQIAESKKIVLDTVREVYRESKGSIIFGTENREFLMVHAYFTPAPESQFCSGIGFKTDFSAESVLHATAKCSDNDEPNEWIGKCVALCKVLHKDIPTFILEG